MSEHPLTRDGCLSFHEVHPRITVEQALRTEIPAGYKIYPSAARKENEKLLLREIAVVHGSEVADGQASRDVRTTEPIVSFRFDAVGARKFESFTRENIGRPFAIVLGGQVISAPVIREPILGGRGQVSGNFTLAEAAQLAARLKAGACR